MRKRIKKVCIVSLGCPKNRVDSEIMAGLLASRGRMLVAEPGEADAVIVNTCSFIRDAKEESIDATLQTAEICKSTGAALVMGGCLPQRYGKEILDLFPEVSLFVGTGSFNRLNRFFDSLEKRALDERMHVGPAQHFLQSRSTPRLNSSPPYTAYMKVAEGCSNSCSFCAIPQIRGPQQSRSIDDICAEAAALASSGVREINLIAQDLTAYGVDLKPRVRLHDLLKELCTVEDVAWIRLLYCYPRTFPLELMHLIACEEKVCKYVDIPLQHIDPGILASMRRGRGPDYVRKLIGRMRSEIPGLVLRTAFIIGYPGETEEKFRALCDFVEEMEFDNAGFFAFSAEEGTDAALLPGLVPDRVKEKRLKKIHSIQKKVSRRLNRRYLGKTVEVLVHGASEASEHLLEGRHRGQAPDIDGVVFINDGIAKSGEIVSCMITQAADYDLVGGIVKEGP